MNPEDGNPSPEALKVEDPLVVQVGSKLHDAWRESRRIPGTDQFEPRIKPTKDEAWIAKHGGKTELDIANTSYEDLPEDWKAENKAAAEAAVSEIRRAESAGTPLNDTFLENASAAQHVAWLSRNSSWAPPEQNLPYDQLSEAEKDKDRVVIRTALDVYNSSKQGERGSTENSSPLMELTQRFQGRIEDKSDRRIQALDEIQKVYSQLMALDQDQLNQIGIIAGQVFKTTDFKFLTEVFLIKAGVDLAAMDMGARLDRNEIAALRAGQAHILLRRLGEINPQKGEIIKTKIGDRKITSDEPIVMQRDETVLANLAAYAEQVRSVVTLLGLSEEEMQILTRFEVNTQGSNIAAIPHLRGIPSPNHRVKILEGIFGSADGRYNSIMASLITGFEFSTGSYEGYPPKFVEQRIGDMTLPQDNDPGHTTLAIAAVKAQEEIAMRNYTLNQ